MIYHIHGLMIYHIHEFHIVRAFAIICIKIHVYFSIRTYFFYFIYSLFKTPYIRLSILHYILSEYHFYLYLRAQVLGGGVLHPQLLFYIQNRKNIAPSGYGFLKNFRIYEQSVLIYRTNCSLGCKKKYYYFN